MNDFRSSELIISNWSTDLVHAKSTSELISFWYSDRSVWSLVSANCSAIRWDQAKKWLQFLADLWSRSEFKTQCDSLREILIEQEVKVIWQKVPHGGPIPRLGVTPGVESCTIEFLG